MTISTGSTDCPPFYIARDHWCYRFIYRVMDQASAAAACTQFGGKLVHLSHENKYVVYQILQDEGKLPQPSLVVSS